MAFSVTRHGGGAASVCVKLRNGERIKAEFGVKGADRSASRARHCWWCCCSCGGHCRSRERFYARVDELARSEK